MNVASCLNNADPQWTELPALMDGRGQVLKRSAMQKLVLSLAQHLAASGIKRGDIIGIATLGHDQYILVTLAVAAFGAVTMPLPKLASKEREAIQSCDYFVGKLADAANAGLCTEFKFPEAQGLANPPAVENLKLFEENGLFRISHSSGTTGTPKAVAITHEEQTLRLRQRAQVMPIQPGQSLLILMGLDAEVTMTYVLYVLARGGALIIPGGNGGEALFKTVKLAKPYYVLSSPHIWSGVVKAALSENLPLTDSRPVVFLAGGKPDAMTVEASVSHLNAILMSDYGSSETGMLSINRVEKMDARWNYAGKLLPGVECVALDPETFASLPKGQVGILSFKAPGMVSHYWKAPEHDRRFFHGGWFTTGDQGCVDEQGFLFVGTRASRVVNRKGVKFDLDLLEQHVAKLSAIKENAWVKIEENGVERLVVVVVSQQAHTTQECQSQIREALGDRYAPDQLAFAQQIPRTPSGKIDRERLLQTLKRSETAPPLQH